MNKLWRVKEQYEEYSSKKRTIAMTFGGRRERILCYERLYKNLNQEQLQQLLKEAKGKEWDTLDLSNCGLADIPDGLWDIKSLKVLFGKLDICSEFVGCSMIDGIVF